MINNNVKPRFVDNTKVFTIPKNIKTDNNQYTVYQGRDGSIVYTPQKKNPFKNPEFIQKHKNIIQTEQSGKSLIGKERS